MRSSASCPDQGVGSEDLRMTKAGYIRLEGIFLCKTSSRMEDSDWRKTQRKVEHVEISARSDAMSGSCSNMNCFISAGRPRREFKGGGNLEGDGEGS